MDDTAWAVFTRLLSCAGKDIEASVVKIGTEYPNNAQAYYAEWIEPTLEHSDNFLISKEDLIINGVPAIRVLSTTGTNSDIQLMWCFLVNQQTVWLIEEMCERTCWDTYEDTFDTMLNSFRFID